MGAYVAAIYMPYSGRIAVLKLQTSDSWALMRSSGAVRGVEGALDGFWGVVRTSAVLKRLIVCKNTCGCDIYAL